GHGDTCRGSATKIRSAIRGHYYGVNWDAAGSITRAQEHRRSIILSRRRQYSVLVDLERLSAARRTCAAAGGSRCLGAHRDFYGRGVLFYFAGADVAGAVVQFKAPKARNVIAVGNAHGSTPKRNSSP